MTSQKPSMDILNRQNAHTIPDVCGKIQELYQSDALSFSIATITGISTPHKHVKMEEIYFVLKGWGTIYIGEESNSIKEGDLISMPKNRFHHIETHNGESIEVIVATHPRYDPSDVITEAS